MFVRQLDKECFHNLLFGDYMIPDRDPEERMYEEVKSVDSFHQIVEQYLEDYNNVHKTHMNLVIFRWSTPDFLLRFVLVYQLYLNSPGGSSE